ncbi:hypothetical protein ACEYW6_10585 [Nostoc sp. UIC 10607]|uniref:hypothetical protein n=1 Tax=Nostoc sp. UIC 10607 TaxID=3045935 RepID=UPI0039A2A1E8
MSQIVGTLVDSASNPLTGKLVVVLAGSLIDDTTTPDTIYLPQSYTFDITAGALDIDLQESETSRITYNFQFFKTDTEGELIEPALINFDALVPNISPVQFASLVPTGLVNDVLDTGALRVARIISTTPALAQNIGGPFPRGEYSPTTTYKYRDLVSYLSRTYISKDLNPITGVLPTNTASWMNIPVEPSGSLILGDATPYGSSWNTSGLSPSQDAVYDQVEDVKSNISLKANLISPIFSGDVIVPNQTLGDASTKAANTNFVAAGLADNVATTNTALALKAPLASPTFTGTPLAPTAATATNTTQIATTAYVKSNLADYATLVSPTLTGDPKAPTPATSDNDTSIATTAFAVSMLLDRVKQVAAGGNNVLVLPNNLRLVYQTTVITTNAAGVATINFGITFASPPVVVLVNGDSNQTSNAFRLETLPTVNSFILSTSAASIAVRVNWVAIGTV